jgi:NAD+ synthase
MTTAIQQHIIDTLNAKPSINPAEEIRTRVEFLKDFLLNANRKGFVLGISGGQDSTLAGKLCQIAVNELNALNNGTDYVFVPVLLPYKIQKDGADAELAVEFITEGKTTGIQFNIGGPVDAFVDAYNDSVEEPLADYHKGNVKARMRMIAQYALAGQMGLIVAGSDNGVEAVSGFFTVFGDGGFDLSPLSGLTKRQEKYMLQELNAPEIFYTKKPTADLLDNVVGQPDETELGVTYEILDDYLEGKDVDPDVAKKIEDRYFATEHKRQLPTTPFDTWWK